MIRRLAALVPAAALVLIPVLPAPAEAITIRTTATAPQQLVGAQLHSLWGGNTPADVDRQLDMLAELHSTTARVDVAWSSLQDRARGEIASWYRDRIDYLVAGAHRRGIKLILNLNEAPCWATTAPESLKLGCSGAYWDRGVTRYPPANVADFAWIAAWISERYGSRVAALDLWNEPNYDLGGYTTLNTPDRAGVYTAMVKAAYPAVKKVAPALPVLAGSMSFADVPFLQSLYAKGIRGSYDGISVHPYNEWRAPGAPHDPRWAKYDLVLGMNAVHDAMLAVGDTSPLWITELGWTTCAAGSSRWCVTEAQQAAFLAAAVPIVRSWSWVRSLVFYNLRDKGTDPLDSEHNFGIVTKSYRRKPAFASLEVAMRPAATAAGTTTATTTTTAGARGTRKTSWRTTYSRQGRQPVTLIEARRLSR